jgi:hypothetical protein
VHTATRRRCVSRTGTHRVPTAGRLKAPATTAPGLRFLQRRGEARREVERTSRAERRQRGKDDRLAEGKTSRDATRLLKRYLAHHLYRVMQNSTPGHDLTVIGVSVIREFLPTRSRTPPGSGAEPTCPAAGAEVRFVGGQGGRRWVQRAGSREPGRRSMSTLPTRPSPSSKSPRRRRSDPQLEQTRSRRGPRLQLQLGLACQSISPR